MQKPVVFVKKNLEINVWKIKNMVKLCIEVAHTICNLKYKVPLKNSYSFSKWISLWLSFYHIKATEEFKKQFTCLGESTEKYITFAFPIEKEVTRIDKNREEITSNISYILQFINSARFMARSLSNLVNNNLSEGIHW